MVVAIVPVEIAVAVVVVVVLAAVWVVVSFVRSCLASAVDKFESDDAIELIASDLRGALEAIGTILGKIDNEAMLDVLFSTFCIGK